MTAAPTPTRDLTIARLDLSTDNPETITASTRRSALPDPSIRTQAATIVAEIAAEGDAALDRLNDAYGGGLAAPRRRVPPEECRKALDEVPSYIREALEEAIDNVRACHEPQRPQSSLVQPADGVTVERVWSPLRRVGVYVPGGRAVYPSSLIMGVVPAQIAGVGSICVATPANPDGCIDPIVLATASLLGVAEVVGMGGAQAVGALAYGTDTIPRVDKIVGPGGPWVTAAKLAVYGECGVDLPAGPSEAAVVVDDEANPVTAAADMLCQAEHGEESQVILVATSATIADAVVAEIERQLPLLSRRDTIAESLAAHGAIVIAGSTPDALAYADAWAPEHLSIHTQNARSDANSVPSAGSVFIGPWTPEAAGDYATGANHVLPTGGLARAYGPLSVEDFGSWRQIQTATRDGLTSLAPTITSLAHAEGLTAHERSVTIRLETTR